MDESRHAVNRIRIRRGLDIPIDGAPIQIVDGVPAIGSVGVLGGDYPGLRARLMVEEGQRVRLGQPLFADKRNPGLVVTSPGAGVVQRITRGPKRALQSVHVRLEGSEEETFDSYSPGALGRVTPAQVRENLTASGLWAALRSRPFNKVPAPADSPAALFVNAMDTAPLAADPAVAVGEAREDFTNGLRVLRRLAGGAMYVCRGPGAPIPVPSECEVALAEFAGPHPAGLVGTHIHFLAPVGEGRAAWHVGYQDVIAIGRLFTSGRLDPSRLVSLAGPVVRRPRLIRTRLGAAVEDIVAGELEVVETRVISGSPLSGRRAVGASAFLGRYHTQVCALAEGRRRELLGWLMPGFGRFSATRAFAASFMPGRRFALTTSQNGSPRAMVPIGSYERVMPLDILPTQLLRALVVGDLESARKLGCLELDEEDLALCSFVCPGKYDYGPLLRSALIQLEREAV